MYLDGTACVGGCVIGYFGKAGSNTCVKCNTGCYACTADTYVSCLSCVTDQATSTDYFYSTGLGCVLKSSCPAGTYGSVALHACDACMTPCYTCLSSKIDCLSCLTGY